MSSELRPGGLIVLDGTPEGGNAGDRCSLVVDNGRIYGDVNIGAGHFRIVPVGAGDEHAVVKLRDQAFPDEAEPIPSDERTPRDVLPDPSPASNAELCDVSSASGTPKVLGPIRIMILYTPMARVGNNMAAVVEGLMVQLRNAFRPPPGNFSVLAELAHTQEVDYTEGKDLGADIEQLHQSNYFLFWEAFALREKYRAHLVHLLVKGKADGCGIGQMNDRLSPVAVFSVSDLQCARDNYSFAHELGHTLGMDHDRAVVSKPAANQFNFGYILMSEKTRTIMAYNDACKKANTSCKRIGMYSCPFAQHRGQSLGRKSASRMPPTTSRSCVGQRPS